MAKGIKAACLVGALAMGLLGATTAARADQPANGQYQFSFSQNGGPYQAGFQDEAVGFFNLNSGLYSNITGTTYGPVISSGSVNLKGVSGTINNDSFGNSSEFFIDSSIGSNTYYGTPIIVANINNPMVSIPAHGALLTAALVEASSGSPSPSTGNAPSPEVNTLVGFLVVAGTVVFVKRRRDTKAEAEDATA